MVNIATEKVKQIEDAAWARLEERILAEVGVAGASQGEMFTIGNVTDVDEMLVFEDEGNELKFLDQVLGLLIAPCCW